MTGCRFHTGRFRPTRTRATFHPARILRLACCRESVDRATFAESARPPEFVRRPPAPGPVDSWPPGPGISRHRHADLDHRYNNDLQMIIHKKSLTGADMRRMTRRNCLTARIAFPALPTLGFQAEKSKLTITSVRVVRTRARRPLSRYAPAPGSWSTTGVEVASPMSMYPEYKAKRSLFMDGAPGGFTVEIGTDKGVT